MTTDLITVNPGDKITEVKKIFDQHKIHHIPVVRYKEIVGIISQTDFLQFLRGFNKNEEDRFVNEARMRAYNAEDLMTKGLAKLSPNDRINVALEIFMENRFHAIPIIEESGDKKELVGILTTFDIIKELASEKVTAQQIIENKKTE